MNRRVLEVEVTIFFWLGLFSLLASLAIALEVALGIGRMTQIGEVPELPDQADPRVSIIIPACNEAETIEPALGSLLALNYENLEIIAVDDRSVDATGQILERMAREHQTLRVHRIEELPAGWLGKNHALQFGADRATGEYLLFTDADVSLESSTLSRALHHVSGNNLDHLAIFFENVGGSGLLNALFLEVGGGLLWLFKPWLANKPKSKRFMGVGAFNLLKTASYRAVGGHRPIAMHPIDDLMLGKLLKRAGFRQDCLLGHGFVSVPWYGTVPEFINGLMKNTFALYRYRLGSVAAGVGAIFLLGVLPLWGVLLAQGAARIFFGTALAVRILSFAQGFRQLGRSPWNAGWSLLTPYLNIYITVMAAARTLRHGGIDWRGTHYPLRQLKQYVLR
jgi:glycosyltransferase involved in cell wall biosynthesis